MNALIPYLGFTFDFAIFNPTCHVENQVRFVLGHRTQRFDAVRPADATWQTVFRDRDGSGIEGRTKSLISIRPRAAAMRIETVVVVRETSNVRRIISSAFARRVSSGDPKIFIGSLEMPHLVYS
jgi:hypothetical protein